MRYLNCRLMIGSDSTILIFDVFSASSQNLFISATSPGISSFSSSAMFCADFAASSAFACGVSLSRQTCFALNGVGSPDDGKFTPNSLCSPPSLLSSLGCCFWMFAASVCEDGNSIDILRKRN